MQNILFDTDNVAIPKTQGIKYAGSKLKLLPQILNLAEKTGAKTVLDGFSGSTRVSQALAQSGYTVASNDIAVSWRRWHVAISATKNHQRNIKN